MKRTVTLPVMRVMAALMLSVFAFAEALAQTEGSYYMNIYYKDGGKYRVAVQDVDKVDFTFDMSLVEGVEYVDLGLSVNWATFNIGADNPEDAGNYYQWGGLGTPELYDFDHCPYANGQNSESNDEQYTKYVLSARYGTVDRKIFLDPQDDAALQTVNKFIKKLVEDLPLFAEDWLPEMEAFDDGDFEMSMRAMIHWNI